MLLLYSNLQMWHLETDLAFPPKKSPEKLLFIQKLLQNRQQDGCIHSPRVLEMLNINDDSSKDTEKVHILQALFKHQLSCQWKHKLWLLLWWLPGAGWNPFNSFHIGQDVMCLQVFHQNQVGTKKNQQQNSTNQPNSWGVSCAKQPAPKILLTGMSRVTLPLLTRAFLAPFSFPWCPSCWQDYPTDAMPSQWLWSHSGTLWQPQNAKRGLPCY